MSTDETPKATEGEELTFDLTITNGAAKTLQKIMDRLKKDSAKEVVSLGLQIIDYALSQDAELIAKKKNGEEIRIVLKEPTDGQAEGKS